ncbi:MAG: adenylate/guanylate cyclase domain-containing protein [Verrucomicrobia bacterium]|nr:adenylate/guanylate cyclase domain-containing protein [Verrucomicrobiota bacterium]
MDLAEKIPDGIYYIVLADLVGSTKFGAEMGNDALTARIQTFVAASKDAMKNARMSSNSGRFIKSAGDGVLFVFSHFPDVVQWAMEFDGTLDLAQIRQEPLRARLCVHAGEVRFEAGETTALAVNQVFKMEKKVDAGELVLTDIAHKLALPSVYPKQCEFEEKGTIRLDGYARPVKLHRLIVKADVAFLRDKALRSREVANTPTPEASINQLKAEIAEVRKMASGGARWQ